MNHQAFDRAGGKENHDKQGECKAGRSGQKKSRENERGREGGREKRKK